MLINFAPGTVHLPSIVRPSATGTRTDLRRLRNNPALGGIPAVRADNLHAMTFADSSQGIRNADAVAKLARMLHPDKFR